eukprot:CAMPEP_0113849610 /NCGR_PEP_ID=MMETSP0372-20130328/3257_1 /TAXON_ID=340204 /ORGANISM="Lankesteria abbotti" /LENGTH=269 /DNA_ID=CAMNT_0000819481 /DNA_START=237 /DNA_END=1046 /DNA_ORIENTATION=- /assembly_acc=CAM_ASM_000359
MLCEALQVFCVDPPRLPTAAFNPYASSIVGTDPETKVINGQSMPEVFEESENIRKEIRQRQKILEGSPSMVTDSVPADPKVFHISNLGKLEDAVNQAQTELFDSGMLTDEVAAGINVKLLKNTLTEGPNFQSRARRQLESLRKQKIYNLCLLRILFPDKTVLQLQFHPRDTFKHVKATVQCFLHQSVSFLPWYIFETPPFRRMKPTETLMQAGLGAGAVLHFGVDTAANPPYLSDEWMMELQQTSKSRRRSTIDEVQPCVSDQVFKDQR